MLRQLTLKSFKAWREINVEFGKVTGLFGRNSSGKSSLLQFLLLLKQTKNATDRSLALDFGGPEDLVNLGSFQDVAHRGDAESSISWALRWMLPRTLRIADTTSGRKGARFSGKRLLTACSVDLGDSGPYTRGLTYRLDGTTFGIRPPAEGKKGFDLYCDDGDFRFIRNQGRAWPLPGPIKTHLFPDQAKTFYQNAGFLGDFELQYEALMDRIHHLGPLREHPKREYVWAGGMPDGVGQRGERTIDALLAATAHGERRNLGYGRWHMPFQEFVAYWLKELGLIDSFGIREVAAGSNIYRAMVRTDSNSDEAPLTDVGFGVSQVLPALVLLYYVPKGSIVLLEQPEIHLHPSAQSGLADAILRAVDTRGIQVIVESHSEHLLRRFQRRVAEGKAASKDVRLYFASMERGAAHLSDIALNEWGEVEKWPDSFFGDDLGEIAATRLAGLQRKIDGDG